MIEPVLATSWRARSTKSARTYLNKSQRFLLKHIRILSARSTYCKRDITSTKVSGIIEPLRIL